ncbi:MAG TPA: VanZ family protein [Thermoanaerobaculia bacterium]|nr:VanZ family protein [Thermoanaerobaculia bacterium]
MPSRTTLRLWLPPLLWTAVILAASGASLSSANTAPWLAKLINAFYPISPEAFAIANFMIRKAAHLTGYGILGALVFRAIRAERPSWEVRWAIAAIVFSAVVASLDEWHQSFVQSRTGTPQDVLLDTLGATLAQVLFFRA